MRGGAFLDEGTDPADDVAGAIDVLDDPTERLPDLLDIRLLQAEPAQAGLGIGDRRGDRLADLMGDRGGELPHRRDAVRVRQLHLDLVVSPLAFAGFASARFRSVRSSTKATSWSPPS